MIATILVSDVTLASNSQLCRTDRQEWQVVWLLFPSDPATNSCRQRSCGNKCIWHLLLT